jgi:hypothetical protein
MINDACQPALCLGDDPIRNCRREVWTKLKMVSLPIFQTIYSAMTEHFGDSILSKMKRT